MQPPLQVHEELAAASAGMRSVQDAAAQRSAALEGTGAQLARSMQQAAQLSEAVQELLGMLGVLGGAVAAGAAACTEAAAAAEQAAQQQGPGRPGSGAAAGAGSMSQQLSLLVDLPAEDIEALLAPSPAPEAAGRGSGSSVAGASAAAALPELVGEAGALAERLLSGLEAGEWGPGPCVLREGPSPTTPLGQWPPGHTS